MATNDDLSRAESAFSKADAAGDTEAAQYLAGEVSRLRADSFKQPEQGIASKVLSTAGDLGFGAMKGVADIGSTIIQPIDYLRDNSGQLNRDRRAGVTAGLESLGADTESAAFKAGDIGVNVGSFLLPGMAAVKVGRAGSLLSKAGALLGGNAPISSGVQMAAGLGAGEVAKDAVKNNTDMTDNQKLATEIAANIGGGLGTGGVIGMARGIGRSAPRLMGAITGDVEGMAGRLINRSANNEASYIQSILESGKVPTISKPIVGYAPRSSEIAGNAGISGLVRHAENDVMNSTQLTNRNFANSEEVKNFLQRKTAITPEKAEEAYKLLKADTAANPFRQNNKVVDLSSVETELKSLLDPSISTSQAGNPDVVKGINALLQALPKPRIVESIRHVLNPITGQIEQQVVKTKVPVKFNEAYNYKQWLDEMLRKPAMDGTLENAIFKSKLAVQGAKSKMAGSLTAVEPEFAPFLQRQAEGIARLERQKFADEQIIKLSKNTSRSSNQSGVQVSSEELSAPQISQMLKNKDTTRKLSADQIESFKRAKETLALQQRTFSGIAKGSNTAQNLNTNQLIMDDVIRGFAGDKANRGALSGIIRALGKGVGNIPLLRSLSPIGSRQAEISAIMAKAELDPKYMAQLMKNNPLFDAPLDPTARGALGLGLRSSLSQYAQ